MKSLQEIYAVNGQDPSLAFRSGALERDEKFRGLVWIPAMQRDESQKGAQGKSEA